MAIRIIRKDGDELLRKKSRKVEKIDEKIIMLLDDMADTLYNANGAGLAAPQVGVLKRIALVDIGDGLIELINPVIKSQSGQQCMAEGCLSIPGIWGRLSDLLRLRLKPWTGKGTVGSLRLKAF